MIKTVTINLAGQVFHIDEDAFESLSSYLKALKKLYSREDGGDEIMADIEARIAEIFLADLKKAAKNVVSKPEVDKVIQMLGKPEELEDGEYAENGTASAQTTFSDYKVEKRMFRDVDNQIIAGVCSGVSQYFGINDPIWLRLLFIVSVFAGLGSGILIYIILWILLPEAKTSSDKLQMKGEPINLENIEKTFREGVNTVGDSIQNLSGKESVQSASQSIGRFFVRILKFCFLIIKGFVLFILGIIIFSIVASLFVTGIGTLIIIPGLANFIFEHNAMAYLTGASIIVFMLTTALFIILLPFQIFSKSRKPLNRPVGYTLGIVWIGALLLGLIGAFDGVRHFSTQKHLQKEEVIAAADLKDTLIIAANEYVGDDYTSAGISWDNWKVTNNGVYNGTVEIDIEQSKDGNLYIIEDLYAKGASQNDATVNVRNIAYNYKMEGNRLIFDDFLTSTSDNNKFRCQKVKITVQVPEGKTLIFDKVSRLINNTPAIKNSFYTSTEALGNNTWLLKENQLIGLDTTQSYSIAQDSGMVNVTPNHMFSNVELSGYIDAEIYYANDYKVFIEDDNALRVRSAGSILKIESSERINMLSNKAPSKVKIYTPVLSDLEVSGLSTAKVSGFNGHRLDTEVDGNSTVVLNNIQVAEFNARLDGVSTLRGTATVPYFNIQISGASNMKGYDIHTENLKIKMDGASNAQVSASQNITGELSGVSTLTYKGQPVIDVSTSGNSRFNSDN